MSANPAFIAVDWGTTNCRAWAVDAGGKAAEKKTFSIGVARLRPGEAEQRFATELRPAFGDAQLPVIMAGMIGSTLGWRPVPYVDCPAGPKELAAGMAWVAEDVAIVPGLRGPSFVEGQVDVMRGEETQLIGWLAANPARRRGVRYVCHPGTHAKWVRIEDGRIVRFVTAMTGELFDVLSAHSVLKTDPDDGDDSKAFEAGVAAAGDGSALAARLFTVRSRVVGGVAKPETTRAYLSGLLIGADAASGADAVGAGPNDEIALIGEPTLCERYGQALKVLGRPSTSHSGEAAVLAGLTAMFRTGGRR